jgi:hypothetical protein
LQLLVTRNWWSHCIGHVTVSECTRAVQQSASRRQLACVAPRAWSELPLMTADEQGDDCAPQVVTRFNVSAIAVRQQTIINSASSTAPPSSWSILQRDATFGAKPAGRLPSTRACTQLSTLLL